MNRVSRRAAITYQKADIDMTVVGPYGFGDSDEYRLSSSDGEVGFYPELFPSLPSRHNQRMLAGFTAM